MEYGDLEAASEDADTSDYSVHQFIAKDEARDPMGSDDSEQDAAHNDAARSKILSAEVFDSEDVPSPDNFLQISKKVKRVNENRPRQEWGEKARRDRCYREPVSGQQSLEVEFEIFTSFLPHF